MKKFLMPVPDSSAKISMTEPVDARIRDLIARTAEEVLFQILVRRIPYFGVFHPYGPDTAVLLDFSTMEYWSFRIDEFVFVLKPAREYASMAEVVDELWPMSSVEADQLWVSETVRTKDVPVSWLFEKQGEMKRWYWRYLFRNRIFLSPFVFFRYLASMPKERIVRASPGFVRDRCFS